MSQVVRVFDLIRASAPAVFLLLSACGGGSSGGSSSSSSGATAANQLPEFPVVIFDVPENQAQVTSALAIDADGDSLTFSITGGADAAAFTLNAATGALDFVTPPDFENPADADGDNTYAVEVRVSDGEATVSATITVNVINVNNLEVAITYPSPANDLKAHISQVFVFGRITDLEDGVVDIDDINYIDVNGTLVTPDPANPSVWSTRIHAPIGVSTLVVTVVSSSGAEHSVTQELRNQFKFEEPGPIALDSANNRAFVLDTGLNAIVEVDLTNGTRNLFSSADTTTMIGDGPTLTDGISMNFDAGNNRLLVAREGIYVDDTQILLDGHFLAVSLATANRSYLSSTSNGVGSGSPGTDVALDIIADPLNDRVLGIAYDGSTFNSGGCPGSVCRLTSQRDVIEIGEFSGDRSVFAGDISSYAMKLAMDYTNERLLVLKGPITRTLTAIALDTGDETLLSGTGFNTPTSLAVNADGSKAYVTDLLAIAAGTNRAGIIEVNGSTGAHNILSSVDDGAGIEMIDPVDIAIDDAGGRALVTDKELLAVLDVSLDTGDRSVLSGDIPEINYPSSVLADPANQRVFVGTALQNTIFVVDLQTGDLDVVSDSTNAGQPILFQVEGMALDAVDNRLYFVDTQTLQFVDLATGDRTVVSGFDSVADEHVGIGPEILLLQALELDLANDQAYVLSESNQNMIRIDLTTGNRELVSDNAGPGDGQVFILPRDMAVDLLNGKAYVGNAGNSGTNFAFILEVDLDTGDRTIISDNNGIGTGGTFSFAPGRSLAYDTVEQRLIYFAGTPVTIDIATGNREDISINSGLSPTQLGPQFPGGTEDISLDPVNGRAYVAERIYSGVFEIELTFAARGVIAQ